MKYITTYCLIIAMLLSLTACGEKNTDGDTAITEGTTATTTVSTTTVETTTTTSTTITTTTTATTTTTTTTTKPTTTTKKTTTTTAAVVVEYSALELELFRLLNVEREKAGVQPLKLNDTYHICAETRAKELSVQWSHTRPDGQRYNTVFAELGLTPKGYNTAENIGMGSGDAASITKALMDSEPHRNNMLHPDATEVLIAIYIDEEGTIYLDEIFMAPKK